MKERGVVENAVRGMKEVKVLEKKGVKVLGILVAFS